MPAIKKRETTAWIKAVADTYGKKVGEIAYIFCSDEKILEVNRQYLQHDYYTDIIIDGRLYLGESGFSGEIGHMHILQVFLEGE